MECKDSVNIRLDLEADETIEKLQKIKQLLKDIKEINNNIVLSNAVNINRDSILIFKSDYMLKEKDNLEKVRRLMNKFECKCVLLDRNIQLDKVLNCRTSKEVDYITTINYEDGQVINEKTVQYK